MTTIRETIENFLRSWDRHAWIHEHGSWASEEWDDYREAYERARDRLEMAIDVDAENVGRHDSLDLGEVREAFKAYVAAASVLEGQVRPGEGDYIAEGVIDPDGIEDRGADLDVAASWQEWDCQEGWRAFRVENALAINWYREGWGGHRHTRDLWLVVDPEYFSAE